MNNFNLALTHNENTLTTAQQNKLRSLLEQGLPLVAHPYAHLAQQIHAKETQVLAQIAHWQQAGLIKRLGIVVKHRALGYSANAMVVWDIKEVDVDIVAAKLAERSEVSLCYRRPRHLPHWPYNLFCMIHGKCRKQVLAQIDEITTSLNLQSINKAVLFSYKAFKQQGARYQRGIN
jgi:DNA-binding Lrp family transcriptional regulator